MILKISVENYKSFDNREELSMISSSKIQTNKSHRLKIKQVNVLKNAVVYGANASGKSNLVDVLRFMKETLSEGLPVNSANYFCRNRAEIGVEYNPAESATVMFSPEFRVVGHPICIAYILLQNLVINIFVNIHVRVEFVEEISV